MLLSIIIVNYNVKQLLKECLYSVITASQGIDSEQVVENLKMAHSRNVSKKDFPTIKLITNNNNPGFSKANNQAIRKAKGKHILLLNP